MLFCCRRDVFWEACLCFWFIQTWGQVLDDKPMAVIPMAGLVKVKSLTTLVSLSTSTDGLGLMDPLDGDQQLFCEKLLFLHRLFRLLKGAMQIEHFSHCTLSTPASSYKKIEFISCTITQLIPILSRTEYSEQSRHLPRVRYVQQHEDCHVP